MTTAREEFNELMRDKHHRTAHPEDDDARSFLNLSDDDDDDDITTSHSASRSSSNTDDVPLRPSMSSIRSTTTIPRTRYGANTGPKGVISDAQHFRDSQRNHRNSFRGTNGLVSQAKGLSLREQRPTEKVVEEHVDELEEEEDDDVDEDFMRQWRQSRLQQLQNGARESSLHSRGKSRRRYGSLTAVDTDGFLDAVDNSPADTAVLVYIYDDYSQVSTAVEECLHELAKKFQTTRFVKLHFQDAEMEPAGVPALLAYRGGDKFAGLVPIIDEIPEDANLSATTLEALLKRHQILR